MSKGSTVAKPSSRYKSYSKYKDSGIEWLGKIPEPWNVKRLKRVVRFKGGGTPAKDNADFWRGDIPWVSPKDMKVSVIVDTEDKITPQAIRGSATSLVPAGAVLIVVRSGILAHSIPVALAGCEVTLNQDLKAMISRSEILPQYLVYLISGKQRELLFEWKKEGATVESLELDLVVRTPIPVPDLDEQRAIAAFLDRETAKIDALVAKKKQLIELLQEKRAALITQAVTKGLDPTVPMKDSGVEWLGKVPAHWKLGKMWDVSWASSGGTPPKEVPRYWNGEIPWVSPKDMKRRLIDSTEDTVTEAALSEAGLRMIVPPAVLVVVRGMILAHTFPVAITTVPVTINQDMKALRLRQDLDPEFFGYWLEGLGRNLLAVLVEEAAHGTKAIRMDRWRVTPVQIPPIEEQRAIRVFLDSELGKIDALVAKVVDAVDRLKELRTALISATVTGKIDVRGEAA